MSKTLLILSNSLFPLLSYLPSLSHGSQAKKYPPQPIDTHRSSCCCHILGAKIINLACSLFFLIFVPLPSQTFPLKSPWPQNSVGVSHSHQSAWPHSHHDLCWILVSLLYGWGSAWVFVGLARFDLLFLYRLVWFGGFLFGGLTDDGFRFEKSYVLMKYLVFLGVGFWMVCVVWVLCISCLCEQLFVDMNSNLISLQLGCCLCWVSFKICMVRWFGWLELI